MGIPLGPGVDTTFPGDSNLFPNGMIPEGRGGNPSAASSVEPSLLDAVRQIRTPGDRSLALQKLANAAIFSNQLALAHTALDEAARAGLQEPAPLVHDQRLISILTSYLTLAEAHLREGKADMTLPDINGEATSQPKSDRTDLIRRASDEWQAAATLAGRLVNPTYRNELLYRVADSMAYGSQTIVNDFPAQNPNSAGNHNPYAGPADRLLVDASTVARRIERPVWRDRALVSVASAASSSKQYARGLEIARMIPQPEVRTDALLRIAESQARRDDPRGATATYREAAQAVASIPLDDPRSILAGVLIDNLVSVGRFEDARSTISLYPDTAHQVMALGAIAESQGRRGAAESARAWIARDVPAEYRPQLYRRVVSGIMTAIEQNRSRDLSNRDR